MTITLQSPAAAIFHKRARSIYGNMKNRAAKFGLKLPFNLENFEGWLIERFRGNEAGVARCEYSGQIITAETFFVDHKQPVSEGGSFWLDNLALCTEKENLRKGNMTDEEYRRFRSHVLSYRSHIAEAIFRKLEVGDVQRFSYFRKQGKSRREATMRPR